MHEHGAGGREREKRTGWALLDMNEYPAEYIGVGEIRQRKCAMCVCVWQ